MRQGRLKLAAWIKVVRRNIQLAAAILTVGVGVAWAAAAATPQHYVSQKDQIFSPGEIVIKRGETVQIVNDDGDLQHHLYVDSKEFEFDSGDQEPGAKVDITFPKVGTYNVLCGIHPKMKLVVQVE